jgi:hypothetical protein
MPTEEAEHRTLQVMFRIVTDFIGVKGFLVCKCQAVMICNWAVIGSPEKLASPVRSQSFIDSGKSP